MADISYAIALTFPDDIMEAFDRLREKYNKYVDYKIVPHITLVYPFSPMVDISTVEKKLEELSQRTRPFSIVFDSIQYFEKFVNVAYAAVMDKQRLVELITDIDNSLKGLIKIEEIFRELNQEDIIPHMTISDRIPDDVFTTIKEELADYKLYYKCDITDFTLFSAENDGNWQRARVFDLQG